VSQSLDYRFTKWHKLVFVPNVSMEREGKERGRDEVRSGKENPRKFVSLTPNFLLVSTSVRCLCDWPKIYVSVVGATRGTFRGV
jgi:hypothetical protein